MSGLGTSPPREHALTATATELHRHVERLHEVPTLPRHLEAVVAALEDPEVDLHHVAELIAVDPPLTAQVLRLANSAFHGVHGHVTSVDRALVVLGASVTRTLVVSTGVFDLPETERRGLWEHSLGCAVAAAALARVTGRALPEECAAAGLLHDLGKLALRKELPAAFAAIEARARAEGRRFREVELDLLGVDHCEIASWMVGRWRFPATIAEPIVLHHAPGRARRAAVETAIVHVADAVVRSLGIGNGGDARIPALDLAAWRRLDIDGRDLDRVLDQVEIDLEHVLDFALFA